MCLPQSGSVRRCNAYVMRAMEASIFKKDCRAQSSPFTAEHSKQAQDTEPEASLFILDFPASTATSSASVGFCYRATMRHPDSIAGEGCRQEQI